MPWLSYIGRLAGVFALVLQLAACSYNVQSEQLQQHPPGDLSPGHELTQTPFFPQERYQCGPAALATVLGASGVEVSPEQLVDQVYLPARQGSVPIEMEAAARRNAMLVYPLQADLATMFREVAAGHPVLLLQNLGLSWMPRWHYAVVVGYDLTAGEVILRSGTMRRYRISMALLETTWRRGGYWARVILPPGRLPASAEALPYIRAALALEQSGQKEAARMGYRAATEHWPTQALAWLARGNLAYGEGNVDEAERSFRSGIERVPEHPDLWNNLAYTLADKGCGSAALAAVACAISLAPENTDYRSSREELRASTAGDGECVLPVLRCPVSDPAAE